MTATVRVTWTPSRIASLLDLIVNDCDGVLTTDHAQSSRGLPVLVRDDGTALGVGEVGELTVDCYPDLGHDPLTAEELATIAAARTAGYTVRTP